MKKSLPAICLCFIFLFNSTGGQLFAQCNNADFENGNFNGWTGTYSTGVCIGILIGTLCGGCYYPDPLQTPGINQGPNNAAPNSSPQFQHFIMTGGYDPNIGGTILPVVYPGGGSYSARLGNMWVDDGSHTNPDAETMSYAFTVTPSNCNFTYHYAVALTDGGHSSGEQPFFQIRMTDGTGTDIACASYDVDANSAATIGGFTNIGNLWYKGWSSVFIPLNNFMGQNVKITFTTRSCKPSGCFGSHYAYAYIDADCGPLQIVSSSPTVCGGQNITLAAPVGAATYSWTGPSGNNIGNTQQVTVSQAGHYHVDMTTFGTVPCNFSLDTVIAGSPGNPVSSFSATTVCVGNPTTFTDNSTPAGSVSGWAWDFDNNGTTDATTQNTTHTFPAAGTYPVKLTVTWTPCIDDTTINVVVSPAPTSTFTATSPLCTGTNSTITYTGNAPANATYTWNFDGGTVASGTGQGPYQVNWATGGTKNITLTVSIGSCVSSITTVPVTVNPFPGTTVSPNVSICIGGSTVLTAANGTTYTWTPATGLSGTTGPTVTANPIITTTYTVTGANANCTSPASVTVTVNPIPTSSFTVISPVCMGQNSTLTYTGNASSSATYTWGFDGGTANPTSGQGPIQVNWSTPGIKNITLPVSENGCTSPLTTIPVVVNPGPTSTFTATSPLCIGQNSTITYTGTGTVAATYTWGFNGGTIISGAGQGPYQINWASTGTKNVTLTVSELGCPSPVTTVPVVVNIVPTSTFTVITPVCAGQNSTITYTGNATGAANYVWGFDGGTVASGNGQGPYQVSWVPGTSGTKNITLTVDENGCTSTQTIMNVVVNPTPTPVFTVITPVCTGQNSTITYTGTGTGGAVYTWGFDGGTIISGAGQGAYQITWATSGTKNITLNVAENGCSANSTVPVVVNGIPTSTFTVVSPVCAGQNSTITYTGTGTGGANYVWNFDGGTVVSGSGQGPYQVSWAAGGTGAVKNITLTVDENGCTSPQSTNTITVNDIPVSDAGADVSFCSGNNAQIGTANNPAYTYSWQPTAGLSDPAISNPVANGTNVTNAVVITTYTVTTSASGCSSTDVVDVTINPVPVPVIAALAGQCLTGNNFAFAAGGSFLSSASFAWDFSAGGTPATSTAQNQNVSYSAPGNYAVTLTVTQNTCAGTANSSVDVYPMPVVGFTADTLLGCENFDVCFTDASVSNSPSNYQWNFGDGGTSALQNPCHTFVAPGVYSVALNIISGDGCTGAVALPNLITVVADPVAAFTLTPPVIQLPESNVDLANQSTNASTFFWTFDVAGTSTDVTPHLAFTAAGSYPVVLFAYNQLGCYDSVQHLITVLPPEDFFIPNVFTPNGDGNNDVFNIYSEAGVEVLKFQVFNRWGEKVHDDLYPWDGMFKGKPSPPGVYIYIFNLKLASAETGLLRKGSVTLVR